MTRLYTERGHRVACKDGYLTTVQCDHHHDLAATTHALNSRATKFELLDMGRPLVARFWTN